MNDAHVEVDGRQLKLTNLPKPLYPSGFTKAEVIDYYTRIAPVLLPHLAGRAITAVRFPNGSDAPSFYAKNLPSHAPDWVGRVALGGITYGVVDGVATLVWLANLAALELHVPLHRAVEVPAGGVASTDAGPLWHPDRIVFDLDPGHGAGIAECARVALRIRALVDGLGLATVVKTSGSKGMQVYARPAQPTPYEGPAGTTAFAKAVAEGLERLHPDEVVSKQTKTLRPGKVLIDWSQNVAAKTTVCVYSLRARDEPTVSTPVTWDEVEAAADGAPLRFTAAEVLARVAERGDLFRWPSP